MNGFMGDSLQEHNQDSTLPSPPRSIPLVAAASCAVLIAYKDKLMHCKKHLKRLERLWTHTMPDVSADAFRPLLTFLGLMDNLILRRPSALFSTLVTTHLTNIPGEYRSEREFKSCPETWSKVSEHINITTLIYARRPEIVTEFLKLLSFWNNFEIKIPRKVLDLWQHYNKRQEISQTPQSQYRGRESLLSFA